jgi:hypothetical protein
MNFRNPYARLIAFAAIFILVVSLLAAAAFAATPAFSVHKNGTAQTVVGNTATKLTWSTEAFDTNTNFASDRFTPTIAGTYLIVVSVQCAQPGACIPAIYKNGALYAASRITNQTFADQSPQATALVSMNGTTDYIEAFATSAGTSITGLATQTYFSGSQIDGAGNGSSQWVDGTAGAIYYNGGNVGIGTTSPSNLLHVELGTSGLGAISLTDSTAPGSSLSLGEGGGAANSFLPLIRGFPSGSAASFMGIYSEIAASNDTGTVPAMVFTARQTPAAALTSRPPFQWRNSGTNLMTIDASGNVGIGSTSPQSALDLGQGTNGRSIVWGGSTGVNHYASIGTTYSHGALSLVRGLKLATGGADQYLYSYATGTRAGIRIGGGSAADISFFNEPAATQTVDAPFDYIANTKMTIKENGNVGIGTSSPGSLLSLQSTGSPRIRMQDADGVGAAATPLIEFFDMTPTRTGFIGDASGSNLGMYLASDAGPLVLVANSIEAMRIDANGNVGIGTATPGYPLDVVGAIRSGTGNSSGIIFADRSTPANSWQWYSAGNIARLFRGFNTNADVMSIDADGNVGIGTTSPAAKLVISGGSSTPEVRVTAGTNNGSLRFFNAGLATGYAIGMQRPGDSEGTSIVFASFASGTYTKRVSFDAAGNADIDGSVTASSYVQRCPAGFTLVGNATRSLGCIQTAENAAATWPAANDACFDNYGGRLAFSTEWHIAAANYALTGETGNWEWLADGVGDSNPYDNHAAVGLTAITDFYWNADSGSYTYRCFLPN